jgi:hypothetical protein
MGFFEVEGPPNPKVFQSLDGIGQKLPRTTAQNFRAPRKISTYGLMTGVRDPGAADRSILDLSSRLSVAPVFLAAALIDALTHTETHDAPVHLVAVAILSRQMKRRML